ncbi:MAG: diguanylate cyclase [Desulfuromonadales bacterium]
MSRSIASGILFGLLGFAGNWFGIELFFNLDFLFGSFFVVFALLRFGPTAGILAGIIASFSTYWLWSHPWAIVIFSSEAVFLAWRSRRPGRDLLTIDLQYWLFLGVAQVWVFYHLVMGISPQTTELVVLKQALNGVVNTLLAILAYLPFLAWRCRRDNLPSFRQLTFLTLVSLVVLPAFTFLLWDLRLLEMKRLQKDLGDRIIRIVDRTTQVVPQRLEGQLRAVQALAQLANDPNENNPELQSHIEMIHAATPALSRMSVFDRNGLIVAHTPPHLQGESAVGRKLAQLPFLAELQEKKTPLVSDIFPARMGEPVPLMAVVAPILRGDELIGYCGGILDVDSLSALLRAMVGDDEVAVTILDRVGQVVASTRRDYVEKGEYRRPEGEATLIAANGILHWVPHRQAGTSAMQRWMNSFFIMETKFDDHTSWTVVVEASAAPMVAVLNQETLNALVHMAVLLLLAVPLSHLFSGGFNRTILKLQQTSTELVASMQGDRAIVWPFSRIRELDRLSRNFQQVNDALFSSFKNLRDLNENLEQQVSARTRDWERTFDAVPDLIVLFDKDLRIIQVNRAVTDYLGIAKEAVLGRTCSEIFQHGEQSTAFCLQTENLKSRSPQSGEMVEKGTGKTFFVTTSPIFDEQGHYLSTVRVGREITDQKKLQEKLEFLSLHDDLTGLYNRRAFDQELEKEWRRGMRFWQPLSILLIDIDHFKAYNDTWGHPQGDACLQAVAHAIDSAAQRAGDFVARYGGEEFAVILPATTAADALSIAEKIRLRIEAVEIGHADAAHTSRVTVSIGIATGLPKQKTDASLLVRRSDQALYAAKSLGRNCVVQQDAPAIMALRR